MKQTSAEAKSVPTPFQKQTVWRAYTGVAITVIGVLVVGAILLTGKVLSFLQPVLVPVAVAGILAYLLDPIVVRIRRDKFFNRELTRIQTILLVYIAAIVLIALLCLSVIPPLFGQTIKMVNNRAKIVESAQSWADTHLKWVADLIGDDTLPPERIDETIPEKPKNETKGGATLPPESTPPANPETAAQAMPTDGTAGDDSKEAAGGDAAIDDEKGAATSKGAGKTIADKLTEWLRSDAVLEQAGNFIAQAVQGLFGALAYLVGFALVPIYLFFFLKDSAHIRDHWKDYVPLKASKLKDEVVGVLQEINGYLIAYFRGQVLVSLIDGVVTGLALTIMGLPYAIVIGVFLALLGVIPFVGIILTWVPAVLIAAAHFGDWQHPLAVTIIFIVVQQVDGNIIQPKIVGESVGLHPLTIIFSVLFWSLLIGGLLGALLAVPLTASIKVLFQRYLWERRIGPALDAPPPEPAPAAR